MSNLRTCNADCYAHLFLLVHDVIKAALWQLAGFVRLFVEDACRLVGLHQVLVGVGAVSAVELETPLVHDDCTDKSSGVSHQHHVLAHVVITCTADVRFNNG